jgi:hypothetical protein
LSDKILESEMLPDRNARQNRKLAYLLIPQHSGSRIIDQWLTLNAVSSTATTIDTAAFFFRRTAAELEADLLYDRGSGRVIFEIKTGEGRSR